MTVVENGSTRIELVGKFQMSYYAFVIFNLSDF
jgi:hypothetical protein